jgi:hypothetical protein
LSLRYVPFADKATVNGSPLKGFEKSTDMFHGVDVRADFAATDTILIEGQVNVSFGEEVLRATEDATGGKDIEVGDTYFGFFGGLGANIGFTETLSFGIGATLWADTSTTVSKYDGSAADAARVAAGWKEDGIKTETLTFGVEGTLTYAVSSSASTHIGLKFSSKEVKVDGKKDDTQYPATRFSIPVGITVKF